MTNHRRGACARSTLCLLLACLAPLVAAAPPSALDAARNFPVCENALRVLTLDLDADNDRDLAVTCYVPLASPRLQLLQNRGDGTFQHTAYIDLPGDPIDVAAADLTGDGRQDIVLAYARSDTTGRLLVLVQTGAFAFSPVSTDLPFNPTQLCVADFDGSGNLDIALGDSVLPHTVHVYLNAPTGGFALRGSYDTETTHRDFDGDGTLDTQCTFSLAAMRCGDLTGDGLADVVATNRMFRLAGVVDQGVCLENARLADPDDPRWASNIVRLLNLGGGRLGGFVPIADQAGGDLALGDVDADRDLDIASEATALSGPDREELIVLRNLGSGAFAPPQRQATGAGLDDVSRVTLVDLAGTGACALAALYNKAVPGDVTDPPVESWALLRNAGTGVFTPAELRPANASLVDLGFAELDKQPGLEALVLSNRGVVSVYYARADGYTRPRIVAINDPRASVSGTEPTAAAFGDWNGDGYPDLGILTNHNRLIDTIPDTLVLLNGQATGLATTPRVLDLAREGPAALHIGPIDATPPDDIGILFVGQSAFGIALGSAALAQPGFTTTDLAVDAVDLALIDLAPGGNRDLALARYSQANELTAAVEVYASQDDGRLTDLGGFPLGSNDLFSQDQRVPLAIAAADVDGNSTRDLLVASQTLLGDGRLTVVVDQGNYTVQQTADISIGPHLISDILGVDVTRDGLADLVYTTVPSLGSTDPGALTVIPGTGGGNLGTPRSYAVGRAPRQVVAADIDGANGLDLLVASDLSNEIVVLFNDGGGNFDRQERYASGGGSDYLAVADIDGDGDADVAVISDDETAQAHVATVSLIANIAGAAPAPRLGTWLPALQLLLGN
jgi:hypothetical protein